MLVTLNVNGPADTVSGLAVQPESDKVTVTVPVRVAPVLLPAPVLLLGAAPPPDALSDVWGPDPQAASVPIPAQIAKTGCLYAVGDESSSGSLVVADSSEGSQSSEGRPPA